MSIKYGANIAWPSEICYDKPLYTGGIIMSKIAGRPKCLVAIRHAQSLRNEAKRGHTYFPDEESRKHIKGIPDFKIDLTSLGYKQAHLVGKYLRDNFPVPDFVYDSDYLRTDKTASCALSAYTSEELSKIQRRKTELMRERDPGYTYDMLKEDVDTIFPWFPEYWQTMGNFYGVPIGGESLAWMVNRVRTFLRDIFSDRDDQTIFIFTHGGTIRCLRYLLEHWSVDHFMKQKGPNNCGITVYNQIMVPAIIDGLPTERKKLELKIFNDLAWASSNRFITT